MPVVNLRRLDLGPGLQAEGDQIVDLDDQLAEMIALRDEGKIGAIGISAVALDVLRRALPAGIVCVQNAYSLLDRSQEAMIDVCTGEGIAWVPYFPLGSAFPGFPKVSDNPVVLDIAVELGATPSQVRVGMVAGTRADHIADSRHPVDRAPRRERGAGSVTLAPRRSRASTPSPHPGTARSCTGSNPSGSRRPPDYCCSMTRADNPKPPWWLKPANKVFIQMSRLGLRFGGESPWC